MKKHILIALVCASLMLITPFTVIAQENKICRKLIDEPNIAELVAQIRTRINEKLEKYEIIPKLGNILEKILYLILFLLDEILFRIFQVAFNIILFPLTFIITTFILIFILFLYLFPT